MQTGGQNFALYLPFTIENFPGLEILISKPCHFPCTGGTLEKYLPRTLARLSPTFPVHVCVWGGGGGEGEQWLQKPGALSKDPFLMLHF